MDIKQLKENGEIKFIYKLPNSLYDDGFEYIIVGNVNKEIPNSRIFTIEE